MQRLSMLVLLAISSAAQQESNPTPGARLQALQLLARAQQISLTASPWNRPFLLSKIAQTLFLAGETDQAKTTLHLAWDSFPEDADAARRAWILVNTVARTQASVGDKEGVRDCIQHLKDLMAGTPEEAWDRMLLGQVVSLQIQIGDLEEAEQTIRMIPPSNSEKVDGLRELAAARVRKGDLAAARRCARGDDVLASTVLQQIVGAQIESGDLVAAAETAASIPSSSFQASARADLAVAQFNSGDHKAATVTLTHALKMASGWDDALKDVAMAQARMSDFASATQTLSAIKDHEYSPKSEWFADLATLAFKSDRGGLVADLLSRAMAFTKLVPDEQARSQRAQRVMLARAETGDVPAALEFANELSNDSRIKFLDQIATIQAKAGDISGAEHTASQLPEAYAMLSAGEIALAKAKAGDFSGASQTAKWQEETQLEIMRAQTKAGDLAGALSEAEKLRAPKMQVDALVGIAQGLLGAAFVTGGPSRR